MKSPRGLLALFCLEAFAALLWTFLTPSESGRAVFLWLSRERMVLSAFALTLWLAILAVTVVSWRFPSLLASAEAKLDHFCVEQKYLGPLLLFLLTPTLLLLGAVLAVLLTPPAYAVYRTWAPDTFPLLHSLVGAALPLLLLAILTVLESGIFLALRYRTALAESGTWSWNRIGPSLLALLVCALTAFYWLVLIFQLRFFVNNPAWYWKFEAVAFNRGDLAFAAIALILLGLAYWALILRRRIVLGLVLLFLLAWFLQFSVGLMSGGGLAAFRDRYFSTYHKTYLSKATQGNVTLLQAVTQYEQLYGSRAFTNTKPPGLMVFYVGLDHLINGFPSAYPEQVRYQRLSDAVVFTFPVLAALMVFALYAFARRYVPGDLGLVPLLAPFLLVLCPNLTLFSLFPDQAVYPLLFLLGVFLIIQTVWRRSLIWAFALGLFLYLAVFFAFTMLPLYPFAFLYLAADYWINRQDKGLRQQIFMGLAIAAGTLLLYVLFRLLLNYDFLPRFEKTVAINHNFDFYLRVGRQPPSIPESLPTRLAQILGAAWLNNLDFAAGMGFPIYVLFVVQGVRLLYRLWRRSASPSDAVLGALLLSFLVLNMAGTAQGEVPRLWLFWLPMVVMLAALQIETWIKDHPRLLLGLALVQLITLFLTFHFQDLRM